MVRADMKNIKCFAVILLCIIISSCAQKPTRTLEQRQNQQLLKKDVVPGEVQITEETILIDARPNFDYATARVPGSHWLDWTDFTNTEKSLRGIPRKDLYPEARKLAAWGVDPNSHVVVIGRGLSGQGEEGRLAWTLRYLGVRNVQIAPIHFFKTPTSLETPARARKAIWKPEIDESWIVSLEQFVSNFDKKPSSRAIVIDVRSEKEYLGKDIQSRKMNINFEAINIPWKSFVDANLRTQQHIVAQLEAIQITKNRPIYIISNQGVRSAFVTVVLRDMGYEKAANFSGGYQQLTSLR